MRWYVAHSYKNRELQKELIDSISEGIKAIGDDVFVFTREYSDFGPSKEKEMMSAAMQEMDKSDGLIAEVSTKEIGVGLEVGYFAAQKKPIIYIFNKSSEISTTVLGVSSAFIAYESENTATQGVVDSIKTLTNRH